MSILINMEMPKSCDKCIYSAWSNFYQIYVCNAVRKNEPVLFDGKQTKSTVCARSARADNCPLISVPPHYDLIDHNALKIAVMDGDCETRVDFLKHTMDCINKAPVVIPSDMPTYEEEDGEL